jgi:uncharacterized protein YwgA
MNKKDIERKDWVLLTLATEEEQTFTPIQLQKSVFLIGKELDINKNFFDFEPYDYGPFDVDVYRDAEELQKDNLVYITYPEHLRWNVYSITQKGIERAKEIAEKLDINEESAINNQVNWVLEKNFRELVNSIYKEYPKFAENSILRG